MSCTIPLQWFFSISLIECMLILYKLPNLLKVLLILISLLLYLVISGVINLWKQWIFRHVCGCTLYFEFLCQDLHILYGLFIPVSLSLYLHLLLQIFLFRLLSHCGSCWHILKQIYLIFFLLWSYLRGFQALFFIRVTILRHFIIKTHWSLLIQLLD